MSHISGEGSTPRPNDINVKNLTSTFKVFCPLYGLMGGGGQRLGDMYPKSTFF